MGALLTIHVAASHLVGAPPSLTVQVAGVVVGLTAVWSFIQPKIYRAKVTVEVQPQASRVAAGQDVSGLGVSGYGWFAEEKYHNTKVEIIQSRRIAAEAFKNLALDGLE